MKHIPNLISILRLLLVGVFVSCYFTVGTYAALAVFFLAGVSDVLDGYLARRNGWITPFGKLLDPLADKLMQLAALLCLFFSDRLPVWILLLFCVKEAAQTVLGFLMFRLRGVAVTSRWYGKCTITAFYVCVFLTAFAAERDVLPLRQVANVLWLLTAAGMLLTLICYIWSYAKKAQNGVTYGENCEKG